MRSLGVNFAESGSNKNDLHHSASIFELIPAYKNNTMINSTGTLPPDNPSTSTTKLVFEVILLIIVGSIGIAGNIKGITNIACIKRPSKFQSLMATLFVFDAIFIFTAFMIFTMPELSTEYKHHGHMYIGPMVSPILQMSMTGALYCQMAFTVERYLVVCHPLYLHAKQWSVKIYIIPLVAFSVVYNLPKFFEIKTSFCDSTFKHESENHTTILWIKGHNVNESYYYPTEMRRNYLYRTIYLTGMNIVSMLIFPFLVLILLNMLTLMNLKRYQENQKKIEPHLASKSERVVALVRITLAIVVTSVLCHSIKWVPTIYEMVDEIGYQKSMGTIEIFDHVSHFFLVFNASICYYIYNFK